MQALAQQQQQMQYMQAPPAQKPTLFVGSISGGITDAFLTQLLEVSASSRAGNPPTEELYLQSCGKVNSFKRLITPANKPQGFGFAEYNDPDSALRAMELLNGVELPALEDGCANKKLLVR
jgi:RNA recognition motif-containing protein